MIEFSFVIIQVRESVIDSTKSSTGHPPPSSREIPTFARSEGTLDASGDPMSQKW
jgi:hypothetical protein